MGRRATRLTATVVAVLVMAACAPDDRSSVSLSRSPDPPTPATEAPPTTAAPVVPATGPTTTTSTSTTTSTLATPTTRAPVPRVVVDTGFSPYAQVGPVVLHHPASRVETVGFHESGHDGAQQQDALTTTARPFVMETRDRGTGDRTAADIVVDPAVEVRAPVTGTVRRAGAYTLYCDTRDEYLVIEPDARPGWEVKLLHFEGLAVGPGQRVEAGVTVVGARGRVLPFESQVDEFTARPAWPHLHVEVVDPSIPDRPTPGGGCP